MLARFKDIFGCRYPKLFKTIDGYFVRQTGWNVGIRDGFSVREMKSIDAHLKLSDQQWRYSEKEKIHPRDNKCIRCQIPHQDAGWMWVIKEKIDRWNKRNPLRFTPCFTQQHDKRNNEEFHEGDSGSAPVEDGSRILPQGLWVWWLEAWVNNLQE